MHSIALLKDASTRGFVCWPEPSAFARYAIYAVIGLLEVFGLFTFSLDVEKRIRNRGSRPSGGDLYWPLHPQRELTPMPRLGFACPRLGMAAGADTFARISIPRSGVAAGAGVSHRYIKWN